MYSDVENPMVVGDYYPEEKRERDPDAEYDRWRDQQLEEETRDAGTN